MCPQGSMTYSNIPVTCGKMLQGGMKGKKHRKTYVDKNIMGSQVGLLNFVGWMTNLLM